ncbi:acylphosphatase [bacterium]|nr:acylphosphatase [bacterium]
MRRAHVFIKGRVQGVFFRQGTYEKAMELGISGWVRNLPDGRVEAVFEGEEEKVNKIIQWAKEGPPIAEVEEIDIKWEKPTGEFDGFQIRY